MLFEIPIAWLIVVNVGAWPVIHMAAAWLGTQLPLELFPPDRWCYRERRWELRGRIYEVLFAVRSWKDSLPDGAALFKKGFRKKRMSSRDPAYLSQFRQETCRSEAVHWAVLACSAPFFLWNIWWVGLIIVAYAVAANLPCIIAQRYNRARLNHLTYRIGVRRS